ncbi:MAG: acyltransferase [Ruminococcaceae bacterium]|nr:acyltransferase [Oscillospiraceae bacterium]
MLKTQEIKKPEFLSIEKTNTLKGLFAIFVLIHHIGQNTTFLNGTFFQEVVNSLGYLSVGIFLFLSGYGLFVSYKLKGHEYINNFPKRRLLPFYIQNLILIAIYLIFWEIIGQTLSTRRIVLSFFFGHTVIKYGWYIQATLVLYVLFFIAFKFKPKLLKITTFILGYVVYFGYCLINHFWSVWYISVLCFAMGIIFANINNFKKQYFALLGILFAVSYVFGNFINNDFSIPCKMLSAIAFSIIILEISKRLTFRFNFLNKLSKISFEIYVSQGIFLTLYHSKLIYVKNNFLYIVLVTVSTIFFSIMLNKLFKLILQKNKIKKPKNT